MCPMFAPPAPACRGAYVGRKSWAQPHNRSSRSIRTFRSETMDCQSCDRMRFHPSFSEVGGLTFVGFAVESRLVRTIRREGVVFVYHSFKMRNRAHE